MGMLFRFVVVCCLAVELAACASTSAVESQTKQRDAQLARLYFLREKGLVGAMGGTGPGAEIKIDGSSVGTVANGTYIFADRPPGRHILSVENRVSMGSFETEVQVDAGQAYYFSIAPASGGGMGQELLNQGFWGGQGEPMQTRSPLSPAMSGVALRRLDPSTGAGVLNDLKAP